MFHFSDKSLNILKQVHPDLSLVAKQAIQFTPIDFAIGSSSVRTLEEQKKLLADGKSTTMRSRHVIDNNKCHLSCAIDVIAYVDGKVTWDAQYYRKIAQSFVTAAIYNKIQIELGILWGSFIDGPHIQLPWIEYP